MSRKSHKPGKHIRKENKKIIHHNLRDISGGANLIDFKPGTNPYPATAPSKN
ncbi:hypothetical protein [Legionella taurinensis]|uniref:hypothetical protein n=1 Tax=Legionella taurinensis TaxID=70611 RepID=UPI00145AE345|nr:hypothetical protein [Legionella taurinensis]MDX1837551.1 hypothetical protein [Legionella taurinensis]